MNQACGLTGRIDDRFIYALKQALGFRHAPYAWTTSVHPLGVRLEVNLPETTTQDKFGAALETDLTSLLGRGNPLKQGSANESVVDLEESVEDAVLGHGVSFDARPIHAAVHWGDKQIVTPGLEHDRSELDPFLGPFGVRNSRKDAHRLLKITVLHGMLGIGINQDGLHDQRSFASREVGQDAEGIGRGFRAIDGYPTHNRRKVGFDLVPPTGGS